MDADGPIFVDGEPLEALPKHRLVPLLEDAYRECRRLHAQLNSIREAVRDKRPRRKRPEPEQPAMTVQ